MGLVLLSCQLLPESLTSEGGVLVPVRPVAALGLLHHPQEPVCPRVALLERRLHVLQAEPQLPHVGGGLTHVLILRANQSIINQYINYSSITIGSQTITSMEASMNI